jgi:hypothetical protein
VFGYHSNRRMTPYSSMSLIRAHSAQTHLPTAVIGLEVGQMAAIIAGTCTHHRYAQQLQTHAYARPIQPATKQASDGWPAW